MQPGGHVDGDEELGEAARREVREETGLAVHHPPDGPALVHVDVHEGGRGHRHLDVRYLLQAPDAEPDPPEGESQDVAWFRLSDAVDVADPGLVAALRAVAASTSPGEGS